VPDAALEALPPRIGMAWITSVASAPLTLALLDALAARCTRISFARTQARMDGVRMAYAEPRRLGVDRFLALLAAHARAPQPWLVVGVGTALTIDLLGADGIHHGGRIAPSPALMRESLHARAAQLPLQGGAYVAFATDTAAALASGCEGAARALVVDSLHAATQRLGSEPVVLLHGGGADALQPAVPAATVAPNLVLEGLARWVHASGAPRRGNRAA
jgi:type III pantothenate kinase